MRQKLLRTVIVTVMVIVAVTAVASPRAASAHEPDKSLKLFPSGYWGPLTSCVGSASSTPGGTLPVCTSVCDILHTFQHFVYFGMSLVLFALAPILIIWGGFLILTAGASSENLNKGKSVLKGTVIGVLIALGAWLIINTFLWVLGIVTSKEGTVTDKPPIGTSETGAGKLAWPTISCTPPAP